MTKFQYQLAVQFPAHAGNVADYLRVFEAVDEALAEDKSLVVDGYDSGLGEFNIFVHTNTPINALEKVRRVIVEIRPGAQFAAGYRDLNADHYVSLGPPGSEFRVA